MAQRVTNPRSLQQIADACDRLPRCLAFSTDGYMYQARVLWTAEDVLAMPATPGSSGNVLA